jgi:hypothetical protein
MKFYTQQHQYYGGIDLHQQFSIWTSHYPELTARGLSASSMKAIS